MCSHVEEVLKINTKSKPGTYQHTPTPDNLLPKLSITHSLEPRAGASPLQSFKTAPSSPLFNKTEV